ncbi:hypothetical protein CCP4SC76_7530003 [Gammaproteobacteria bacterium]
MVFTADLALTTTTTSAETGAQINAEKTQIHFFTDPYLPYGTVRDKDFNLFTVGLDFVF